MNPAASVSDLAIINVCLFDGVEMRKGIFNVGVCGTTSDVVTGAAVSARRQIDAAGRV